MICSIRLDGSSACITIEGATDAEVFRGYVRCVLCPTLRKGEGGALEKRMCKGTPFPKLNVLYFPFRARTPEIEYEYRRIRLIDDSSTQDDGTDRPGAKLPPSCWRRPMDPRSIF